MTPWLHANGFQPRSSSTIASSASPLLHVPRHLRGAVACDQWQAALQAHQPPPPGPPAHPPRGLPHFRAVACWQPQKRAAAQERNALAVYMCYNK
eukprot:364100-Chlamydomonas_euryale.AAC.38